MSNFVLGSHSLSCLGTLSPGIHPDLRRLIIHALSISDQDFGFTELQVRTPAYQAQLVARGVSHTMKSKHLIQPDGWGHACDAVPWVNGSFTWDWVDIYPVVLAFKRASIALDIPATWGGVWDRLLSEIEGDTVGAMEAASQAYVKRFLAANPDRDSAFIDGPHFQLNRN